MVRTSLFLKVRIILSGTSQESLGRPVFWLEKVRIEAQLFSPSGDHSIQVLRTG